MRELFYQKHFVIVDDEPISLSISANLLERFGAEVTDFLCPLQALEYCKRWHSEVDIFLTDIVMPKLSGTDLTQQLMQISPSMIIIGLSANQQHSDHQLARISGMKGLLDKPMHPAKLADILTSVA